MSKAERQPAHATFVPQNKKSCSANLMVAVALQALLYGQCWCKDLPALLHQAHGHVSYPFPPALWLPSLHCPCCCAGAFTSRATQSNRSALEITPVFRFCFIQLSCAHSVVKEQKRAKQWAWRWLGCSFVGLQLKLSLQASRDRWGLLLKNLFWHGPVWSLDVPCVESEMPRWHDGNHWTCTNLLCQFKCVQKILKESLCPRTPSDGAGTVAGLNLVKRNKAGTEIFLYTWANWMERRMLCAYIWSRASWSQNAHRPGNNQPVTMAWDGTEVVALPEWSQCTSTNSGLLQESCESRNSRSAPGLSTAAFNPANLSPCWTSCIVQTPCEFINLWGLWLEWGKLQKSKLKCKAYILNKH